MRSKMQEFNYTLSPNSRRKKIGSGERRSDMQIEKHPIDAFSCNVKTARPRLKTDTIASIEKKSLLSTGKYTYKARVLSFQHFEYDYRITCRTTRIFIQPAPKIWSEIWSKN